MQDSLLQINIINELTSSLVISKFILNIYIVLFFIFFFMCGFIILCFKLNPLKNFFSSYLAMNLNLIGIGIIIILSCLFNPSYNKIRKSPWKYICFILLISSILFILFTACIHFEKYNIFISSGIILELTTELVIYTCQSNYKYTSNRAYVHTSILATIISGLLIYFYQKIYLDIIYSAIFSILFMFYTIYNIQLITIGDIREITFYYNDYILVIIFIYINIFNNVYKLLTCK